MRQVIDVARACGVEVEYALVDRLMEKIYSMPGIGSSMQVDMRAGRAMEVDVILGVPVRRGREFGVAIETLEAVYVVLRAVDVRVRDSL